MNRELLGRISAGGRAAKRVGEPLDNPRRMFSLGNYGNSVRALGLAGTRTDVQPKGIPANAVPFKYNFGGEEPNPFTSVYPTHDEGVNARITPFGRRYFTPQGLEAELPPPGAFHLALVKRAPPVHDNKVSQYISHNAIPGDSVFATTVLQWNFIMAQAQVKLARDNPDLYFSLTPRDLWWGIRDNVKRVRNQLLEDFYGGWTIDGTVILERGIDGEATLTNEGFRMTREGLMSPPVTEGGRGKVVTIAAKGACELVDMFEGRGIAENARGYLVLRKFPAVHDATALRYTMGHKPMDSMMSGGLVMSRDIDNATVEYRGKRVLVQPFQLACVMEPDGDALPFAYAQYKDERGLEFEDGLIMPLFRVVHAPTGLPYRAPHTPEQLTAYTSGRLALDARRISIVMDADDGLRSSL